MVEIGTNLEFWLSFPSWFLVTEHTLDLIRVTGPEGQIGFPIFTDRDILDRYREDPELAHYAPAMIVNRDDLRDIMAVGERRGYTHFAVDPTDKSAHFLSFDLMRAAFEDENQ